MHAFSWCFVIGWLLLPLPTPLLLSTFTQADFPRILKDSAENLAKAMSGAHFELVKALRPTPARPFAAWNLRHVQRMLDGGLLRTNPDSCYTVGPRTPTAPFVSSAPIIPQARQTLCPRGGVLWEVRVILGPFAWQSSPPPLRALEKKGIVFVFLPFQNFLHLPPPLPLLLPRWRRVPSGQVEALVSVWVHEAVRAYGDGAADAHHLGEVEKVLQGQVKEKFPNVDIAKYFPLARASEPLVFSTIEDRAKDREDPKPRFRQVPLLPHHHHHHHHPPAPLFVFRLLMRGICSLLGAIFFTLARRGLAPFFSDPPPRPTPFFFFHRCPCPWTPPGSSCRPSSALTLSRPPAPPWPRAPRATRCASAPTRPAPRAASSASLTASSRSVGTPAPMARSNEPAPASLLFFFCAKPRPGSSVRECGWGSALRACFF